MRMSYHGSANLKAAFLREIGKHEAADALMKGTYGMMNSHFRGCAIGCSVYSLNVLKGQTGAIAAKNTGEHTRLSTDIGWPVWLAHVEDHLFEQLLDELWKTWPRRLAEAMPVGATEPQMDLVLAKLLHWMLVHERFGIVNMAHTEDVKKVVTAIAALFERAIAGDVVPDAEWNEVARNAWHAWDTWAAWAARAAWVALDAWVARAALDTRVAGAVWAARATWSTRAARDAEVRDAFYPTLSETLLRLLRELQPPSVNTMADTW